MIVIPDLPGDADNLTAALAYGKAGLYVGPAVRKSKHPGSIVGKQWQTHSSRDPEQIAAWFAGTDHDIWAHAGRSGLLIADVDVPGNVPEPLDGHLASAPFHASRPAIPGYGHYLFAQPEGRPPLGNGLGKLAAGRDGSAWGQIRGRNGCVMVFPSAHRDGGEYRWLRTGQVPAVPDEIVELLLAGQSPHEDGEATESATDAEVLAFVAEHSTASRPGALMARVKGFDGMLARGAGRHDSLVPELRGTMEESHAGLYAAQAAIDALWPPFWAAASVGPKRRSEPRARAEFYSLLSFAIAEAVLSNPETIRKRVDDAMGIDGEAAFEDVLRNTAKSGKGFQSSSESAGDSDTLRTVPWPTLGPAALSGTAGEVLRPVLAHTESDTAALLVTTLALFGATVNSPHVLVANQTHRANLHALIVGSTSGGAKGTSWGAAKALLLEAVPLFGVNIDSGLNSGEGLIERVRDDSEDGNGKSIPGVADKRLVILEEEYRTVLTRGKREGNSLPMVLRLCWDGAVLRSMTRKANSLTATGAHIAVVGHVTPREFVAVLADSDLAGGSVNRLLITLSRRRRLSGVGLGNIPPGALRRSAKLLAESVRHAGPRRRVSLSTAAAERWEEEYHRLTADRPDSRATDATARAASQVIRLALIYTLLDKADEIGVQQLEAALALWDYCDRSARWLFSSHAAEASHNESTKLLDFITGGGPAGRTRTEISVGHYQRNRTAAEIDVQLEPLVRSGAVIEQSLPTDGRTATVYVPSSVRTNEFTKFAGQGDEPDEVAYEVDEQTAEDAGGSSYEFVGLRSPKTAPDQGSSSDSLVRSTETVNATDKTDEPAVEKENPQPSPPTAPPRAGADEADEPAVEESDRPLCSGGCGLPIGQHDVDLGRDHHGFCA